MEAFKIFFSPFFMAFLMLFFAVAMAVATFIENDFGREAAYNAVYAAKWFEFIMLLLVVNLAGQIVLHQLYRREKVTVMFFHLAFIIIIIGAATTRYTGYEGTIHIREGEEENRLYSVVQHIGYTVKNLQGEKVVEKNEQFTTKFLSSGKYDRLIKADGEELRILLARVIRNAEETVADDPSGAPLIEFMVGMPGEEIKRIVMAPGDTADTGGLILSFGGEGKADIKIEFDTTGFYVVASEEITEGGMMKSERINHSAGSRIKLSSMQVLSVGNVRLVPGTFTLKGTLRPEAANPEEKTGKNALVFHVITQNKTSTVTLWQNDGEYLSSVLCPAGNFLVEIRYGSLVTTLPFSLKLNDFIVERYPGSNMPSGYRSEIILNDNEKGVVKPYSVFMNNVLKHRGYRFYQASYDRDEKGTILSVNHDIAGMLITYTGYAIMFLFFVLSLFNRKSLFRQANIKYWYSPFAKYSVVLLCVMLLSGLMSAGAQQRYIPGAKVAEEAGKILIQDHKGRTEPLYTLSYDILRKVTGKNEYEGLSPMQVFTGVWLDFEHWQNVPLIKISNRELRRKAGTSGKYASFNDLVDFSRGGLYKIAGDVQSAYSRRPAERTKYDKEVLKTDEKVNILYMIYTEGFLKIFPLRDSLNSWGNFDDALKILSGTNDTLFVRSVFRLLTSSLAGNNVQGVKQAAEAIYTYQKQFSGYKLPPPGKIKAEIIYHRAKVFERLFPFYATLGIIALALLLWYMIKGKNIGRFTDRLIFWFLAAGFAAHTAAYFIRWYISGHVPLSNGFESMIFISWVTMLAGFLLRKRSDFALPATAFLSAITLLVAHMSFMDPEITNLVPVLKSYWLTIHVSVITSSYAFFGLGAILGLIVLLLLIISSPENTKQVSVAIENLTVINYRTLIIGLYLLTTGTFLGAIWANESWGRYWGWDPKETWTLVTIIVYTFVTHSNMIPQMRNVYAFNLSAMLAVSSVLMTYFGVNYYLSGLHSYAGGDPIPVPDFIYIAVAVIISLSVYAYIKYKKWDAEARKSGSE